MKSLSDYKDTYREIASNLNLQGESVDLLVNLLANASYIEEVENIAYSREANLETAQFMNSKIIHCINQMYSVFRGSCPRVIMRFRPDRAQSFSLFDEISVSNNFKIYYLGYYAEGDYESGTEAVSIEEGFTYAPLSVNVGDVASEKTFMIIGLLAKETVDMEWTIDASNPYYVNCTESGLSNDMYLKIGGEPGYAAVTRHFSDHVEFGKIFDLTIPDFGSRLYFSGVISELDGTSTKLMARYFKYTTLSEYNESELKKVSLKGAELIPISEYTENNVSWLESRGYNAEDELTAGILYVDSNNRDSVISTHYKANRERYLGSIVRSNSDLGDLLVELYPEKVKSTHYNYDESGSYVIYYIPKSDVTLTEKEKQNFIENRKGYFVTNNITISEGKYYDAIFNIKLNLVDISDLVSVKNSVSDILDEYSKEFNVDLRTSLSSIRSRLSKISNIENVASISITYLENGEERSEDSIYEEDDMKKVYFNISSIITSSES